MLRKIFFVLFFIMVFGNTASADYLHASQDSKTESVEGRVASIDWVSSTLVVKFLVEATYQEMKLFFPSEAKIIKSNEEIELSDIELDDLLSVDFYADQKEKKNVVIRAEVVID